MDERTYLNILYDYYGKLFTDKQRYYFEEYYFNNLSLGEISENKDVSRNAVHKQLKKMEFQLKEYEKQLGLYNKRKKLEEIISNIDDKNLKKELEELI